MFRLAVVASALHSVQADEIEKPNGIGCDICKQAVNKVIDAGVKECETLCQKAPGSLKDICEKACSMVETKCESSGSECAEKVCEKVKLCKGEGVVENTSGDCISDLVNIAKDFGEAGVALKGIVSDCTGDDRTKCQQDVDQLLQQLTVAVQDVDKSTTSCGSHGPDCVAEIQKLSEAINAIDGPAKKMADECAGQHKSILNCAVDGGQVAVDVVSVGKEIADVVSICKKGIEFESTKTDKCCVGKCTGDVNKKYWSIAKGMLGGEHCGECCMDPKKYDLFHFFEKNLTKSESDTPCKDFGYTVYDSTPTHGFGPVSMTLDLYNKPKTSEVVV